MPSKSDNDQHKCCGVADGAVTEAHINKEFDMKSEPKPWIVLKLLIPFTVALMVYGAYVYIGIFCLDMIKRHREVGGSRGTGIALLVVFSILLLWTLWAYIKVVVTPPGYARDYISKSSRPMFPDRPRQSYNTFYYDSERSFPDDHRPRERTSSNYTFSPHKKQSHDSYDSKAVGGPTYERISFPRSGNISEPVPQSPQEEDETNAVVLDALPRSRISGASMPVTEDTEPRLSAAQDIMQVEQRRERPKAKPLRSVLRRKRNPSVYVARKPPQTPVLLPVHRYCGYDEIVKPYRTHHCKSCGTCILKYDHHCPWIGQCVGARNQKFFFNFTQAASVLELYVFTTLLPYTIKASSFGHVDPQQIVVLVLSVIFALFTITLQVSHFFLIWHGQTTVESMQTQTQKSRETRALDNAFGFWGIIERRRARQQWDREWGNILREGNIWWLGSGEKGWVDVMGTNPWGWFLPIGRSLTDGLSYPVNPRFDAEGRWRRRAEWPKELQ